MSKPQVLVFIDWYKPYFKAGGPVRSMVNLVDHLADRIDFHIVTGDRDYMATTNEADVPVDQWVNGESGERVMYVPPSKRSTATWRQLLKEKKIDVVYINGLYSRWSTIVPLWLLRGSKQRRIVAVRGMLAAGPMKQSALKKRLFLFAMKATGCFKGVEFQATNDEEAQDIKRWIGPRVKVHLVQNLARRTDHVAVDPLSKIPGELRLVSLARIAEEKNTLYAIERLDGVKGQVRFDLLRNGVRRSLFRTMQSSHCSTASERGCAMAWTTAPRRRSRCPLKVPCALHAQRGRELRTHHVGSPQSWKTLVDQ